MILISIRGMSDGSRNVSLEVPVDTIEKALPEFFGNITLEGTLRKIGDRFAFAGQAACMARLVCDRSLVEFDMLVEAGVTVSFLSDNCTTKIERERIEIDGFEIDRIKIDKTGAKSEENIIRYDDKQLDLTEEVIQRLIVSIPMKKVAPEYENADFNEIFNHETGRIAEDSISENDNLENNADDNLENNADDNLENNADDNLENNADDNLENNIIVDDRWSELKKIKMN